MPSTIKIDDDLLRKAIALIDREEEDWIAEEINDIRLASPQYAGKSLMEICHLDFLDEPGFREELEMEMYRRMGDRTQAEVLADFINDRRIVWAEWAHEKKKLNQGLAKAEKEAVDDPTTKGKETMSNETKSIWMAMPSENAEFEHLEAGAYPGVCCGVTARDFTDYNDRSKKVTKAQFIFQISEGQGGQCQYLRTRPFTIVLNEKSNLYTFINTWTGASLERMTQGFDCSKMVGFPAQVIVTEATGKDGKVYAEIANVLKAKKGSKTPVVPDAIPAYLTRGAVDFLLAEGLTVKEDTVAAKAANFPAQQAGGLPQAGGVQGVAHANVGGVNGGTAQVPAGAKVTQAADAKGWIQNPPAQPAGAVPNVGATAEDDSDDMDLPF